MAKNGHERGTNRENGHKSKWEPLTGDELPFSVFQIRLFLRFSVFFHVSFNSGFSFTTLEFPSTHPRKSPFQKNHQKSNEILKLNISNFCNFWLRGSRRLECIDSVGAPPSGRGQVFENSNPTNIIKTTRLMTVTDRPCPLPRQHFRIQFIVYYLYAEYELVR